MARTPSTMVPLGTSAPDFRLPDTVSGSSVSLGQLKGETGTLVMFICNHCPFVKHVNPELLRLSRDYAGQGISLVAISSNDALQYPEDGPERMKETAAEWGYDFPYLYDESQSVARAYDAACTPDFFLFDQDLALVYRGQLDESRPGNGKPLTGKDMRNAFDALLARRPVDPQQFPGIGCNIKWKKED
jgi:peroxiredoxin